MAHKCRDWTQNYTRSVRSDTLPGRGSSDHTRGMIAPENAAQTGSTAENAPCRTGGVETRLYVENKELTDPIMATGTTY